MTGTATPTTEVSQLPDPLPDDLTILDVREPVEWEHGHIPGAVHVPMRDLPGVRHELPNDNVVVVCRIGARSAQAVDWLNEAGHSVVNLRGGMIEWASADRPIVSENGEPPRIV